MILRDFRKEKFFLGDGDTTTKGDINNRGRLAYRGEGLTWRNLGRRLQLFERPQGRSKRHPRRAPPDPQPKRNVQQQRGGRHAANFSLFGHSGDDMMIPTSSYVVYT
ncbi:hypothetical protein MLD38_037667 [Melastoma candidum]|uniref:Uncharacterized protein n=1 Tax=Melastoma candidum TaxID=119954 RepID=A0ACB9LP30_9MYRT|nr:hypothetical protein MLD38_037667 [Melastoma candidum]